MGDRGARREPATALDIAQMRELACEAMRAGAIGFSTSRSLNHRTIKGDPTPMLRATEEELTGIAMGLADAGSGVLQFVSDFDTPSPEEEFAMIRRIAERSGRPVSISLAQRHDTPQKYRLLLKLISDAVEAGLQFKAQVAPRPIGVLMGLQGSRNPFTACPSYQAIAHLPLAERVAMLREDAALKARLLVEVNRPLDVPISERLTAFHNLFPFSDPPDYSPPPNSSIAAQAQREGKAPAAVAYDWMLQNDGKAFLFTPFANFAGGNLDACREMLADPNTVMGLGDGGAHVSIISDASFPTFLLSHWGSGDTAQAFDLSWLVKRQTSDTARTVGLNDRGVIAPNMKGDINIIDLKRLSLESPRMHGDLPAGGKRLLQGAEGYVATIVSGQVVYRDGRPTAALPGLLVRGPQQSVPAW
ncbi:Amidohydrolase family protein [compost metagenome]